jgi:hypothetical protein
MQWLERRGREHGTAQAVGPSRHCKRLTETAPLQGDVIDYSKHITSAFKKKIFSLSGKLTWDSEVVISLDEPEFLPKSLSSGMSSHSPRNLNLVSCVAQSDIPQPHWQSGSAKQLCVITSNLQGVQESELKPVKKRIPGPCCFGSSNLTTQYWYCNFELRVVPAPAELRFELWMNGKKFAGNDKPIEVDWDGEGAKMGNELPGEAVRTRNELPGEGVRIENELSGE